MAAGQRMRRPAAFLDRDGVINVDHGYVSRAADFEWVPGVLSAARRLHQHGFALVVVTNQSGIGRGYFTEQDFLALTDWMRGEFEQAGAPVAGVYFCPHHPAAALGSLRVDCLCRKPAPGMLLRAAQDLDLALPDSVLFGDKPTDLQAAQAAGIPQRWLLATNGTDPLEPCADGLVTGSAPRLDLAVEDFLRQVAA